MSLRESNTKKLEQTAKPDAFKSDGEEAVEGGKGALDKAASYLPGQGKARDAVDNDAADPKIAHDTGRQGAGGVANALKPSGQQTWGETIQQKADQAGSYVEPNQNKSYTQQMKDFVTPGNDSGVHAQTQGQEGQGQGVMEQVSGMATGAKDAVANMFTTEQSGNNHEQH